MRTQAICQNSHDPEIPSCHLLRSSPMWVTIILATYWQNNSSVGLRNDSNVPYLTSLIMEISEKWLGKKPMRFKTLKLNARQLWNTNFPTKRYRRKFARTVPSRIKGLGHNDVSSLLLYYLHKTFRLKYIYIYKTSIVLGLQCTTWPRTSIAMSFASKR